MFTVGTSPRLSACSRRRAPPRCRSARNQTTPGLPIGRAAEIFQVSARNIARAKAILRNSPVELVQAVESGKVAVSRAAELCELPEKVQVAKLQEIAQPKRAPRNTKGPAATGNENTAGGQSGGVPPAQRTPSKAHDFVIPTTLIPRGATLPRDMEVAYEDLLAAWFKAPKLVRLRFKEELVDEF